MTIALPDTRMRSHRRQNSAKRLATAVTSLTRSWTAARAKYAGRESCAVNLATNQGRSRIASCWSWMSMQLSHFYGDPDDFARKLYYSRLQYDNNAS